MAAGGLVRSSCKLLLDFVRNSNAFYFELWAKNFGSYFSCSPAPSMESMASTVLDLFAHCLRQTTEGIEDDSSSDEEVKYEDDEATKVFENQRK